jgi:hypothetical protein
VIKGLRNIFALVLFLAVSRLSAQLVSVDAVLDTAKIRIGEQARIDLYLSYTADKNINVQWPSISDTITEKVEVVSVSAIDTTFPNKSNSNKILQHQQITISVYDSGYFAVPGFKFVVNNDTAHPLFTRPLFIEVHTVPTDSSATKTKDIKPPFNEPFNWRWYSDYIYSGLVLLAIIVATVLITRYYARKRQNVVAEPEKPKIPAHITALAALEKIREESVWKDNKIKEYYSAISETVRFYIEERFHVNALESTTDEIMTAFRTQVVDRESKDKLQQLLMLSDLVKFAKQFPIEVEHVLTLQNAFDFVNGTKREEEYTAETATEGASSPQPVGSASSGRSGGIGQTTQQIKQAVSIEAERPKAGSNTIPPVKNASKKNKLIIALVGLILLLLAVVLYFVYTSRDSVSPDKNEITISSVLDLNAQCPIMLNPEVRLDEVAQEDDKTFRFNCTLVNIEQGQVDGENLKSQLLPIVIEQVKTKEELKTLREKSATLNCQFSDKSGRAMFVVSAGPEDYLN